MKAIGLTVTSFCVTTQCMRVKRRAHLCCYVPPLPRDLVVRRLARDDALAGLAGDELDEVGPAEMVARDRRRAVHPQPLIMHRRAHALGFFGRPVARLDQKWARTDATTREA